MHLSISHLITGVALLAPSAHAWVWTWNDANNNSHVETGSGTHPCSPMDMTRGMEYYFQPKGGDFCIELFTDDSCEERNGYSCPEWGPRTLGQDNVRSWLVSPNDEGDNSTTTTGTSSPTGTTSGSASGTTSGTETGSGTATESMTETTSAPESTTTTGSGSTTTATTDEPTATEPTETEEDPESTETPDPTETAAASSLSGGSPGLVFGAVAGSIAMAFFGI